MKDNKDYNTDELLKVNETKVLFIGFIAGILPFLIILGVISMRLDGIPSIMKNTLIIAGILTACINSIALKKVYNNKIKARNF